MTTYALFMILASAQHAWGAVIGFGAGGAINLAAFIALDRILGLLMESARKSKGARIFWSIVAFLKLPALLVVMGLSILYLEMNTIAFAIGLGLTQEVMMLKVMSITLVGMLNRRIQPPLPGHR